MILLSDFLQSHVLTKAGEDESDGVVSVTLSVTFSVTGLLLPFHIFSDTKLGALIFVDLTFAVRI